MRVLAWLTTIAVALIALVIVLYPSLDAPILFDDTLSESSIDIETFHLSNGMEVIFLPNDRVPAVSHMIWIRVGAADDPQGQSGLAHYHEHLMFKGTPNVPSGEYSRRIEALGGQFNAFTGPDFVGYYVNIAKKHLPLVMQIEADRMQNLTPSDEDYATELSVILEERQSRIDNNPRAQWSEQIQATMFRHHPYRIPIIGWQHEMEQLTPEMVKAFYDSYYHAGNMVLIVAGDITRAELQQLAEQHYGTIPARASATRDWLQEPPALAARTVVMHHAEVEQPRWQRRYLAPSHGQGATDQVMPLSLLAEWLGGGKTSLLYEQLVQEQQLAVSVSARYSGLQRGPSQFIISATPARGVSLETLEEAVNSVLVQAQTTRIASDELKRIKTLFNANAIYARDGLQPLAHYAGYLTMLRLPLDYLTKWERYVDAVTAEQIQQAAQAVITTEGSVTGYLYPKQEADNEAP